LADNAEETPVGFEKGPCRLFRADLLQRSDRTVCGNRCAVHAGKKADLACPGVYRMLDGGAGSGELLKQLIGSQLNVGSAPRRRKKCR
jgi:hypothetical protein